MPQANVRPTEAGDLVLTVILTPTELASLGLAPVIVAEPSPSPGPLETATAPVLPPGRVERVAGAVQGASRGGEHRRRLVNAGRYIDEPVPVPEPVAEPIRTRRRTLFGVRFR